MTTGVGDGIRDFGALVDALPFDVWVRDREDVCVYANPCATAHWPGLVGGTPSNTASSDVSALWRDNNGRALGGEVVRGEVHYPFEGRLRTFVNIVAPVRVRGEIVGTAGINLDVTDLRDREREVAALESLLHGLFDNAPVAIGVRSIRGDDLVHVEDNPKVAALLGVPHGALRGKSDLELGVSSAQVSLAIARFRRSRATNAPVPFELTVPTAEGPRTLVGKVVPLDAGNGEDRYAFVAEDVTELRALLHADRLSTLGTLACAIAHEINNPLTYVHAHVTHAIATLERLADTPRAAAVAEGLRTALGGVEQVASLTRSMLALSKPEPADTFAVADVALTIDSILGLTGSRLRCVARVEKTIDVVPPVAGDPMKLGQVLLNLITNAAQALQGRKAMGTIWISTREAPSSCGNTTPSVTISVADDGPGIPSELRSRLFAAFQTGRREGHGLGLFVCKRLVEEMGGTIVALDREGGGTEMRITLPAVPQSNQAHS